MKTRIFAYKGNLGATTDIKEGKFLNDLNKPGQLGCVIDTKEVEITKDAKKLIRNATRDGGSFAEIMLTKHSAGGSSIGLMGFDKHQFGKNFNIGRDCDLSVLDDCIEMGDEIIPEDYKVFINSKE